MDTVKNVDDIHFLMQRKVYFIYFVKGIFYKFIITHARSTRYLVYDALQ